MNLLGIPFPPWMRQATCAQPGIDPEIFFPKQNQPLTRARQLCNSCPVRTDCLAHALAAEGGASRATRFGIYAGLSPDQRADLTRKAAS